jgi:NTP pyrophosphatase (non-canonical NTP hydrolase)
MSESASVYNWNPEPGKDLGVDYDRTPIPFDHTIDFVEAKIQQWHRDRNLINGSSDKDQLAKLIQEVGELSDHICKGESIVDDVGDIMVVLINICMRNDIELAEALAVAYRDIKDRKGVMVGGVFVKEADL